MNYPQVIRFHKRPTRVVAPTKLRRFLEKLMIFDRGPKYECVVDAPSFMPLHVTDNKVLFVEGVILTFIRKIEILSAPDGANYYRFKVECDQVTHPSGRGRRLYSVRGDANA